MKTRVEVRCCNKDTFASEEEAQRRLERMVSFGLSRVLPMGVEVCARGGWHLTFPPADHKQAPRKPLSRTQMKPGKPKGVPAAVKRILLVRSGGACEIGLACGGTGPAQDPAHREGKKAGGTRKAWANSPATLLAGCRRCHRLIDGVEARGAENLGLKIRAGVARPWEIPVLHACFGWVLLDDRGGHRPAPEDSYGPGRKPTPVIACTAWEFINRSGAFAEALERFGHHDCPGRSAPSPGPFVCGCGSAVVFYLEEAAS